MIEKIGKMRNHTIVCGAGSTGSSVIEALLDHQLDVVVIEQNPETVKHIQYRYPQIAIIESSATVEESLWIANVKAAKNLVVTFSSDMDNIYVVITARDLNPRLFIVARAMEDSAAKRILKAGANDVVSPNKIGGRTMAGLCLKEHPQHSA